MRSLLLVLVLLSVVFTFGDLAAKRKRSRKDKQTIYKYRKKTDVEFSEVEIDAAFQKPEGYYSLKSGRFKFDDMIEPKEDFLEELKNSVYNIDEIEE